MKSKILFFILLFSFSSCKKADADLDMKIQTIKLPPKKTAESNIMYDEANSEKKVEKIEQKIIKEGNLSFETNDLNTTYNQIQKTATETKAFIQNDTEGKDYNSIFRKLIIRVPSQNFDLFLRNVSEGVVYFDNKEISSQDVTAEYIDLNARLKAKKTLENRYLELLKKATKVSEMLEIETQLSTIREEIEAKQAALNYMQNRVSFSTITIEFYKPLAIESGNTNSYGMKIWNAVKSGFNNFSGLFIWILSIWPFLIIFTVAPYFIIKRLKKNKK